jgi:hypothetical protein
MLELNCPEWVAACEILAGKATHKGVWKFYSSYHGITLFHYLESERPKKRLSGATNIRGHLSNSTSRRLIDQALHQHSPNASPRVVPGHKEVVDIAVRL